MWAQTILTPQERKRKTEGGLCCLPHIYFKGTHRRKKPKVNPFPEEHTSNIPVKANWAFDCGQTRMQRWACATAPSPDSCFHLFSAHPLFLPHVPLCSATKVFLFWFILSNGVRFAKLLLSTPLMTLPQLAVTRAADADVKLEAPRATAIFSICSVAPLCLWRHETRGNSISADFHSATPLWPLTSGPHRQQ